MQPATAQTDEAAGDALLTLAREQIVQRLRRAADLLRRQPPETEGVSALLDEALDRTRALALLPSEAGAGRASFSVLATTGGRPVGEFLLIPFGDVLVERPVAGADFAFTRSHAEAAVAWFAQMGRKLAIDYEHQTFGALNTRTDGLRPAAGWIGGLEVRDDGLWAVDVSWTERAANLLRSGEYRYFSPVIFWDDEARETLASLGPVALTNDPAMRGVQALAAKRSDPLAQASGPSEPLAEARGQSRGDTTDSAFTNTTASPPALAAAHAEIDVLRQQLAEQRADVFIDHGVRAGKITAATRDDWRADFLRDAALAEQRLSRAPVILPPGRVITSERDAAARFAAPRAPAVALGRSGGVTLIEAADFDAYERAAAAGFVRFSGRA